jgi:hypothetical protein
MVAFRSNPSEGGRLRYSELDKQQWRKKRKLRTGEEFMWENERGRVRAAFKGDAESPLGGGDRGNRGGFGAQQ